MRIVFPLAIVAIAAGLGPVEAIRLSLNDPHEYERIVSSAHVGIAGFGGAFLAMVGLKFFFDADKDVHWIAVVERSWPSSRRIEAVEIALLLLALWGISLHAADGGGADLPRRRHPRPGHLHRGRGESARCSSCTKRSARLAGAAVRSGLGGFLYLNVLDASFSFDGVIGAFALSNNMIVIALGLSIGAMFVRSMTIHLVEKGTLAQYRYLEHGAFWAIIALGAIMLLSARFHIPETITGLIGAVLIGLSLWWSIRHNRP